MQFKFTNARLSGIPFQFRALHLLKPGFAGMSQGWMYMYCTRRVVHYTDLYTDTYTVHKAEKDMES